MVNLIIELFNIQYSIFNTQCSSKEKVINLIGSSEEKTSPFFIIFSLIFL